MALPAFVTVAPPARTLAVQIRVLFFAVARERVKRDSESLTVPDGATVAQALHLLCQTYTSLEPLVPQLRLAANQEFVPLTKVLHDGDELAVIPPVAGGADGPLRIDIKSTPLSLDAVIAAVSGPAQGGIVTFAGAVRRRGQLEQVVQLEYEAFVPMAKKVMTEIADGIEIEWPGTKVAIQHRIGILRVGETAVVIAAAAPHRAEAFLACQAAIDRLKERVPIWKKEVSEDGAVWVGLGP